MLNVCPQYVIRVYRGPAAGQAFYVCPYQGNGDEITSHDSTPPGLRKMVIGRHPENLLFLPQNTVGRRHIALLFSKGEVMLQHLGSRNRFLLNRLGYHPMFGEIPIVPGTWLELAETLLLFDRLHPHEQILFEAFTQEYDLLFRQRYTWMFWKLADVHKVFQRELEQTQSSPQELEAHRNEYLSFLEDGLEQLRQAHKTYAQLYSREFEQKHVGIEEKLAQEDISLQVVSNEVYTAFFKPESLLQKALSEAKLPARFAIHQFLLRQYLEAALSSALSPNSLLQCLFWASSYQAMQALGKDIRINSLKTPFEFHLDPTIVSSTSDVDRDELTSSSHRWSELASLFFVTCPECEESVQMGKDKIDLIREEWEQLKQMSDNSNTERYQFVEELEDCLFEE